MWILIAIGAGIVFLAHTAPAPFLLDALNSRRSAWHMPQGIRRRFARWPRLTWRRRFAVRRVKWFVAHAPPL
jgi:hypothetical protein